MNYVFDGIIDRFNLTDSYVLLLEEDHYVAPDALYMLNLIRTNKEKYAAVMHFTNYYFQTLLSL